MAKRILLHFEKILGKNNQKIIEEVAEPHHTIRLWLQFQIWMKILEFQCGSGSTTFMTSKNNKKYKEQKKSPKKQTNYNSIKRQAIKKH
jgi:hypothetical protein